MVSGRRLVSVWFALHLSVGIGLMGMSNALLDRSDLAPGVSVLLGAVGALVTASVLLGLHPELGSGEVWRFGVLTTLLFVLGNVPATAGIYAPTGGGSPVTIGLIWLGSMAVAYGVIAEGGYARLLSRLGSM